MRLYLVRHGRTDYNVNHLAQGHLDVPLDEVGQDQAIRLAQFFVKNPVQRILSSDSQRSMHTASLASAALSVHIESTSLLRERSLGELEGVPLPTLVKAWDEACRNGESRFTVKPKGAESAYEVMDRISGLVDGLHLEKRSIAVFTHGMTKEVILCRLLGAPVETSRSFRFDNASITELRWAQDVWVLERFNDTNHLA
jgi:broad specificity phosphatase PhoE